MAKKKNTAAGVTEAAGAGADPQAAERSKNYRRATSFLETILPQGVCIWSCYDKAADGSTYGVFIGPGTFRTNENESGKDVALWMTEVKRSRRGKITRKVYRTKGGSCIYPQMMIEKDIAYDCAQAILKLIDRPDVVKQTAEVIQAEKQVGKTDDDIERKMRLFGLIR